MLPTAALVLLLLAIVHSCSLEDLVACNASSCVDLDETVWREDLAEFPCRICSREQPYYCDESMCSFYDRDPTAIYQWIERSGESVCWMCSLGESGCGPFAFPWNVVHVILVVFKGLFFMLVAPLIQI